MFSFIIWDYLGLIELKNHNKTLCQVYFALIIEM